MNKTSTKDNLILAIVLFIIIGLLIFVLAIL